MLLFTVVNLLTSNAVTLRRDKSIPFSRFTLVGLTSIFYLTLNNLFITAPFLKMVQYVQIYSYHILQYLVSKITNILVYLSLGSLSSYFILFGFALLYANSGTTKLDNIYILINITSIITLLLALFIYIPGEWFNIASIITLNYVIIWTNS